MLEYKHYQQVINIFKGTHNENATYKKILTFADTFNVFNCREKPVIN